MNKYNYTFSEEEMALQEEDTEDMKDIKRCALDSKPANGKKQDEYDSTQE
jgi:hypothetical protein